MDRIRHIATSWDGCRVAVGAFARRVAVWDVVAGEKISEFETVLDFGGRRLAITPDGERVIAGAYSRHGIACYHAQSGELLWHRKDPKKVQHISVSTDGSRVYCGFEQSAGREMDAATGEVIGVMRGVGDVCASPFEQLLFIDRKSRPAELRSIEGARRGRIRRTTFAFLSVAFAPGYVATSESAGPVRCFRTSDAVELWLDRPPLGAHALHIAYDEDARLFQAISWAYHGGEHTLGRFAPDTGALESFRTIPESPEYGFCLRGTRLLTWDGSLLSTSTGEVVARFDFPDTRFTEECADNGAAGRLRFVPAPGE